MTNREFFNAIVNACDIEPTETQWEELRDFATNAIAKLDARNAARKDKPSKKSLENEPIKSKILTEVLTDEPKTASEIASEVGISVQKASALLRQMNVTVTDVKVKGKGVQKGYNL